MSEIGNENCCYTCKNYAPFHGSAGTCKLKGCGVKAMVDALDICEKFEKEVRYE